MHAIETTIPAALPEAEIAVRDALAAQGFGVLTEIDVAATLKAKLGVDRPALKILEPAAGGGTHVAAVDPRQLMPGAEFAELANAAAVRLIAAIDSLTS